MSSNIGYYRALAYKNGLSSSSGNMNINFGVTSSTILISGTLSKIDSVDMVIKDKLITLNKDNLIASGFNSGIEIEENKSITGYLKTNSNRNKWLIKAPTTDEAEIFTSAGGDISGPTTFHNMVTGMTTFNISGNTTINADMNASSVKQAGFLLIPSGSIICFAGSVAPGGWLICDGSDISRTLYNSLFQAIGTTYGSGNTTTTFNLPNFKGKVPVCYDNTQTEFNTIGVIGGAKTHTLLVSEMPSHNHGGLTSTNGVHNHNYILALDDGNSSHTAGQHPAGDASVTSNPMNSYTENAGSHNHTITAQGGDTPHNNLQPYIVIQYIIKY